ncbi:tautomerase family protein [Oceanobacter mangrovi]|uniref:tautomerase family protein n=1 Tax=Oceanobacter mangrovi TaxID=2862510 RepID=UPI001C8E94A6|nr:tautomerase family protein [Oceanobacter mangrovi]
MPVVSFNVPEAGMSRERGQQLCRRACEIFASVLTAPVERIRAYIQVFPEWAAASGNEAGAAPFYQFYVLADRSPEQVAELHRRFTVLLAEVLGIESRVIRGACIRVEPEDWGIAGGLASDARKTEIATRRVSS